MRTVLPERWYIAPTEESMPVLGKWRSGGTWTITEEDADFVIMHPGYEDTIGYAVRLSDPKHSTYIKTCVEITFDEFRSLVLGQYVEPEIPEDLSYLADFLKTKNIT